MKLIKNYCHYLVFLILVTFCLHCSTEPSNQARNENENLDTIEQYPEGMLRLIAAYPNHLIALGENSIIWRDSSSMVYNDSIMEKDFETMLTYPDLEDQLKQPYTAGKDYLIPAKDHDPGRIRFEPFFKKMYGSSKEEVQKNLVEITWLPKLLGQKLLVTKINNVDQRLLAVSNTLDTMPYLLNYLSNPGGTFNWRIISGTPRLSTHSYGIAIDINVQYSDYWQWHIKSSDENTDLPYTNRIPMKIVEIFEKEGFIWGGKWYHFDTMHFEYRPELLLSL